MVGLEGEMFPWSQKTKISLLYVEKECIWSKIN
jgi:hypothetical protein